MSFVDFVERKFTPTDQLARYLEPSTSQNRHSNFGPVSQKLDSVPSARNGDAPGRAACTCSNAKLGLQAAVATFEYALGKHLRWAVSDFNFFTSFQGPFLDQTFVSCDPTGMISLEALAALPVASYDAILATNEFGLHDDFNALFDFAETHGKILLINDAAGFTALAPYHTDRDGLLGAEVVSFHHTKPWGMGEGGTVFLPSDLQATAQILARVEAYEDWDPAYRAQAARIYALGQAAGLIPLVEVPNRVVPGQIAFLSSRPIGFELLDNPEFRILKYYRPCAPSGNVARDLFDRVLNVPCHPGMAPVPDCVITNVPSGLA